MAKKIMLEVAQPYHAADGLTVLYGPGERFPVDADLPADLPLREVIADVPDEPKPKAKPEPEPRHETRPAPAAKPRA